jgi:hypothetical protein
MAKLKLGEVIVDAAVAKLKAGMAARVATINADYNDAAVIAAPKTTGGSNPLDGSDYFTAAQESFASTPAIFVMEGPATLDAGESPHEFITVTKLLVFVADQDANRQVLGKKLQRLARAVIEVIWDDAPQEKLTAVAPFANQDAAWRIHLESTTPGRVFEPSEGDELRGFYLIVFSAKQLEPGQ